MMALQPATSTLKGLKFKDRIKWHQEIAVRFGRPVSWKTAKKFANEERDSEMWKNSEYTVTMYRGKAADFVIHVDELKGQCDYISIRRNDREPCRSWTDFQAIKNQMVGEDREGFEIYPAQRRLVDAANQYHIICLPEGHRLPFGFGREYED
jgi:hypothetical protein